jgi:hypothetical protein
MIKFLTDISIVVAAISKKHVQDSTAFERVFLDGKTDSDNITINLTPEQSENLKALHLNRAELNRVGTDFGEILSGIFLLNRFEPLQTIKYPLDISHGLIDFYAITGAGLEFKISAKHGQGSPAAISSLLSELHEYVMNHRAKNPTEDKIETFVYNYQYQYTECDVVLEGWEIESACNGYFIKWKRCTINEEIESDLCAEDRFIPCIRTRGELSYFESCERYPDTKDCDGNYMFPHYTDSEGNIIMDNIRLFKMPDNHIEPCFECETNNVEPDGLPYEKCYIFPLGLEFSNIVPPSTDLAPKIIFR